MLAKSLLLWAKITTWQAPAEEATHSVAFNDCLEAEDSPQHLGTVDPAASLDDVHAACHCCCCGCCCHLQCCSGFCSTHERQSALWHMSPTRLQQVSLQWATSSPLQPEGAGTPGGLTCLPQQCCTRCMNSNPHAVYFSFRELASKPTALSPRQRE